MLATTAVDSLAAPTLQDKYCYHVLPPLRSAHRLGPPFKRTLLLHRFRILSLVAALTLGVRGQAADADHETFFETQIRPVLAGTCLKCHGGEKTNGGLRVDSRAALIKGGDSGPALVPGAPEKSLLLRAVQHADGAELKMPPSKKLPDKAIADLTDWIKRGAPWPAGKPVTAPGASAGAKHWAFQPLAPVHVPEDSQGWSSNPIDRFLVAEQLRHRVKPVGAADRRTLLRRLSFDLTGLPPTPAEMEAFLRSTDPDAYAREVERLLASPAYGETWGRHWMDVVRYADTAGDNADYPVPEAALYRDYIIRAFNTDKPYDQFVREQLAGDLLAQTGPRDQYADRVVATTFLGLARRYLTAPYESWELTLEDVIDTTGRAFLGLSLRCARCHDHKYDPIPREDYYALYGVFASTQFPFAGSEEFASMKKWREHFVPLAPAREVETQLAAHRKELDRLKGEIAAKEKETPLGKRAAALDAIIAIESKLVADLSKKKDSAADIKAELEKHQKQVKDLRAKLQKELRPLRDRLETLVRSNLPPDVPGAYGVHDTKPTNVPIQIAGDPGRPGKTVPRGVPGFLGDASKWPVPADASGRLELARWISSPANPLTARVMVNRIWQYHFGRGLVATPSNFGLRGVPPTHPALLDWMASHFIESGWSVKAMHRLIVNSKTYQLASAQDAVGADPSNIWYGRFDRRRLDAEAIRDAMLASSGNLELRQGGNHPFPPITKWHWTQHDAFKEIYPTNRRSVYLMTQRLQRHPFLALFDGPDTNVSTDVRTSSTVPLQALYLMNNPFVREQAEGLARRVLEKAADVDGQTTMAYELAYARPPSAAEKNAARKYLEDYSQELTRFQVPATERTMEAWTSLARTLLCANEFMYVD